MSIVLFIFFFYNLTPWWWNKWNWQHPFFCSVNFKIPCKCLINKLVRHFHQKLFLPYNLPGFKIRQSHLSTRIIALLNIAFITVCLQILCHSTALIPCCTAVLHLKESVHVIRIIDDNTGVWEEPEPVECRGSYLELTWESIKVRTRVNKSKV
jgi:hypothetical protein